MRRTSLLVVALGTLLALALPAAAQPAPWYLYESKTNGRTTCAQTSPGEGWRRIDGPFLDGRCSRRG